MARITFALAMLVSLLACGLLGPEEPWLDARADRPEYVRDPGTGLTAIRLTVTNQSNQPAFLSGCPGVPSFVAERQDGETWRQASQVNVICQAIYTPAHLTLLPGESHTTSFSWSAIGTFRLRVPYGAAQDATWDHTANTPSFVVR